MEILVENNLTTHVKMAIIKLNNGFPNSNNVGILLAVEILSGTVNQGDFISTSNGIKTVILEVEPINISGALNHAAILVPDDSFIIWHELFGTELEVECHNKESN